MPQYPGIQAAAGASAAYAPNAVVADGANDFLTLSAPLTGQTDSGLFTAAFAIKFLTLPGANFPRLIGGRTTGGSTRWSIGLESDNDLYFELRNTTPTTVGYFFDTITLTTGVWYAILFSCDLANVANRHVYLNDATLAGTWSTYTVGATVDFTTDATSVFAYPDGNFKLHCEIADLWIDPGRYVDFSVVANRRLFFNASHALVNKGADGSIPFGTAPRIFLSGDTATWHTNKGPGGGFALTPPAALTTSASPPAGA